jgi:hypothetical protein
VQLSCAPPFNEEEGVIATNLLIPKALADPLQLQCAKWQTKAPGLSSGDEITLQLRSQ